VDLDKLSAPFHHRDINWRVGDTNVKKGNGGRPELAWGDSPVGRPLAYLKAKAVAERLDEVCGPGNWQRSHRVERGDRKMTCSIGIKIDGEWIWKENGAGDTGMQGDKGAYSDSFKRAAVGWGVGRYLVRDWGRYPLVSLGKRHFSPETIVTLNKEYDSWLICDEGPIPSLVERQKILSEHMRSVIAIKEGIANQDFASAAEAWRELGQGVQQALWLAPSKGGIFTTQERNAMQNEFSQTLHGEAA